MFGIWYLFLCISLFSTLESNASFIDWSFLTVITSGNMKCSSEQLDSFSIWPSFCKRSNSAVTLGCRFIGTRRPFWCYAVNFWWNFDFATCDLDKSFLDTVKKLRRDCLFNFACEIINVINTFTSLRLVLLYHCEAKAWEKVSSNNDLVTVIHHCQNGFSISPVSVCNCCLQVSQNFNRVVWKCFEIPLFSFGDPFRRLCSPKYLIC